MAVNSAGMWTELSVTANSEDEAAKKLREKAEQWESIGQLLTQRSNTSSKNHALGDIS